MTFRRELLVKRLKEAKKTQESVQSISKLIIHYHENVAVSCETWLEIFQQGSVETQLALWYVANEVVQTAGNKRRGLGTLFKEAFKPNLERALPLTENNSRHSQFLKVVLVWEQRKVYDSLFCERLKNILEGKHLAMSGASSNSYNGGSSEFVAPVGLDSPTNPADTNSESRSPNESFDVFQDQERLARATAICQDFQLTTAHEVTEKCVALKLDAELAKKQYELNNFDITSSDLFKNLKEKSEGVKVRQKFETLAHRLLSLVEKLENERAVENQALDHAVAAHMYFKHQQKEAIVVYKAYKNFGSRIGSLRKKLREKKKTLPSDVDVTSSYSNDMELEEEEMGGEGDFSVGIVEEINQSSVVSNASLNESQVYEYQANVISGVKPLDAPPLNAVSDIMKHLMSSVNPVPSTVSFPASPSVNEVTIPLPTTTLPVSEGSSPYQQNSPSLNPTPVISQPPMHMIPVHNFTATSNYYASNTAPLVGGKDSYYGPAAFGFAQPYLSSNSATDGIAVGGENPSSQFTEQPPPTEVVQPPPLPPSDNGEGGGITTAFFESLTKNNLKVPAKKQVVSSSSKPTSIEAASNKIDSILSAMNPSTNSSSSSFPNSSSSHPVNSAASQPLPMQSGPYPPAPPIYNFQPPPYLPPSLAPSQKPHPLLPSPTQPYPNVNPNPNFSQFYPMSNTSYYPSTYNPQQAVAPSFSNYYPTTGSGVVHNGDVDLRDASVNSAVSSSRMESDSNSSQSHSQNFTPNDFDARNLADNSAYLSDPRKRRARDFHDNASSSFSPEMGSPPKRPYQGNSYYFRGDYDARDRRRGGYRGYGKTGENHWNGSREGSSADQDFRQLKGNSRDNRDGSRSYHKEENRPYYRDRDSQRDDHSNNDHRNAHRGNDEYGYRNYRGAGRSETGRHGREDDYRDGDTTWQRHRRDSDQHYNDKDVRSSDSSNISAPKTIKQALLTHSADEELKETIGYDLPSSSESSPRKEPILSDPKDPNDTYNAQIPFEEGNSSHESTMQSIVSQKEQPESEYISPTAFSHFEAIKKARNVAEEFDDANDGEHNKGEHPEDFNRGHDSKFVSNEVCENVEKTRRFEDDVSNCDDSNDGSVPIIMASESAECQPVMNDLSTSSQKQPILNLRDMIANEEEIKSRQQSVNDMSSMKNSYTSATVDFDPQNMAHVDTSSPEYARWWFYHFGRGRGAARRGGGQNRGQHNSSNGRTAASVLPH